MTSQNKAKHINNSVRCKSKLHSVVNPCLGYWLTFRCGVEYYVRLPTHLVQELSVGTVYVYGRSCHIDTNSKWLCIFTIGTLNRPEMVAITVLVF